jgi:hypothetical protein
MLFLSLALAALVASLSLLSLPLPNHPLPERVGRLPGMLRLFP